MSSLAPDPGDKTHVGVQALSIHRSFSSEKQLFIRLTSWALPALPSQFIVTRIDQKVPQVLLGN